MSYDKTARQDAIAAVTAEATDAAVVAGADRSSVTISDIEEVALSYMAGNMTRLRVKVVGDIAGLGRPGGGSS